MKAIAIVDNISRLRDFLAGNRDAYVDVVLNRDHSISGLSDLERDRIDAGIIFFLPMNQIAYTLFLHSLTTGVPKQP